MNNEDARTIVIVREKDGLATALGALFPLDAKLPASLADLLSRLANCSPEASSPCFNPTREGQRS